MLFKFFVVNDIYDVKNLPFAPPPTISNYVTSILLKEEIYFIETQLI